MLRRFLACAVALATPALADDPALVGLPYVEVGDCWSYRSARLYNHGWIDEFEECITFIDRDKDVILAVATLKDGREIETSYSRDWGWITPIDGRFYRPAARLLRFPLSVGDRFSIETTMMAAIGTAYPYPTTFHVRVVAWEDIEVPAGKFRAIKIEAIGHALAQTAGNLPSASTLWYVPSVRRPIKWSYRRAADVYELELTNYRLNK